MSSPSDSEEEDAFPTRVSLLAPSTHLSRAKKRVRKVPRVSYFAPLIEDPFTLLLLSVLSYVKDLFVRFCSSLSRLRFPWSNIIDISLPELSRLFLYVALAVLACRTGVMSPTRLDSNFHNHTVNYGFSPLFNTFEITFSTIRRANDRFFLYGQFFRQQLPNTSLLLFPPGQCDFFLNVSAVSRYGSTASWTRSLGTIDFSGFYDHSKPILLFYRAYPLYTDMSIVLNVTGNLAAFDTFQTTVLVNDNRFSRAVQFHRLFLGLFLLNVFLSRGDYSRHQCFAAVMIGVGFVPMGFLNWATSSGVGVVFVLDRLLNDLFVLFMYNFWLFEYSGAVRRLGKYLFVALNVPVWAIVSYDSIWRSWTEFVSPLEELTGKANLFDSKIVTLYTVLTGIAYGLFVMSPRRQGEAEKVNLGTFAFFVAMVCHILDEYALRMRILKCHAMWRHLRTIEEIAAVWLLAYQKPKTGTVEGGEAPLIQEKPLEGQYEYEYEEEEGEEFVNEA